MNQPYRALMRTGLLFGVAGVALAASHAARAGFDWVPPLTISNAPVSNNSASPPIPPVVEQPALSSAPAAASPPAPVFTPAPPSSDMAGTPAAIRWNAPPATPVAVSAPDANAAPAPLTASVAMAPAEPAYVPPPVQPVASAAPAASDKSAVQGFGRDIPLPLALRQIVPAKYGFGFGTGVNTAEKLSWHSGAPWDTTLDNALAPHGLQAVIGDRMVQIVQAGSAPQASTTALHARTYTDAELAAIGEDNSNYHPSYPRHKPAPVSSPAAAPSSDTSSAALPHSMMKRATTDQAPSMPEGTTPTTLTPQPTSLPPPAPVPTPVAESNVPLDTAPPPPVDTSGFAAPGTISSRSGVVTPPPSVPITRGAPVPVSELPLTQPPQVPSPEAQQPQAAPGTDAGFVPAPPPSNQAAAPDEHGFDMNADDAWRASHGDSLHDVLSAWCGRANVRLIWQAKHDYKLPHDVSVNGTLPEALARVLGSYGSRHGRPAGELHPRLQDGSAALIIRTLN